MPYGTKFGERNPNTGLPISDSYPVAGSDQGTRVEVDFIAPPAQPFHQSRLPNVVASGAQDIHDILDS